MDPVISVFFMVQYFMDNPLNPSTTTVRNVCIFAEGGN